MALVPFLRSSGAPQEDAASSGVTTTLVPYPATIVAGDCLVLVGHDKAAGGLLMTNPAGWTNVKNLSQTTNTAPPDLMVSIKIATGSESGTLTVTKPTNTVSWAQIAAFGNIDQTTPQDTAATQVDNAGTGSTTLLLPTLSTTMANAVLIAAGAKSATTQNATAPTAPATFTEIGDRVAGTACAEWSYLVWSGSGATGTVTINWSGTAGGVGVLLALRPAPSVGSDMPGRVAQAERRLMLVR